MDSTTRREFARNAALGTMALAVGQTSAAPSRPPLCLFSKHLPKLNYSELAHTVKQIGFDGVDLTVRPEGHVLPARVAEDLPKAVETLHGAGLAVPMITTDLTSANDPAARTTIATAARLGVPRFKLGYWRYLDKESIDARLTQVRGDVAGLAALAKEHGITAGFPQPFRQQRGSAGVGHPLHHRRYGRRNRSGIILIRATRRRRAGKADGGSIFAWRCRASRWWPSRISFGRSPAANGK